MVSPDYKSAIEQPLSPDWFQRFGLRFDPYVHLEASSDPHLAEYTVNLDIFRAAWNAEPAVIVAPPGGGKTATRVAVTRTCWFDMGGNYPFPLPYNPGITPLTGAPPTRLQHMQFLLESGACALLTGLAFRPERLLRASTADIRAIGGILRAALPGDLDYYLAVLRETGTPAGLTPLLERTYALTSPPPVATLHQFCAVLEATGGESAGYSFERLFQSFVDLVTTALGFSHVLILIDGIDAISEHQDNPRLGVQWIASLIENAAEWAGAGIVTKLFAPDGMADPIVEHLERQHIAMRQFRIVWTADLLVELLRQRIRAASDGRFEALDAISSPDLIDVEHRIAGSIHPLLPRAALQVTRHALQLADEQLDETHILQAVSWYRFAYGLNVG